ncbi:hypothetical protein ASD38_22395 [Caulobacter sp. Root487D2Y]|uniref:hypothetical protein n=1 Tax=Caulobacter sp. Root487D2Y TaxID=1736547 RepID=UPI0006FACF8A|nr:hypothetical protein [Caulobacter sp. Root487D2Y]KQY32705.1 hypothetical protein ASD38_22395 [Caulobacter sp. Root487D2Y]
MAACVLALLVVAPTVSMATCLCANDAAIVSVETGAVIVQAVQGAPQDHGAPCEAACCVSGHCHHGGAMLDAPVATVPALAPVAPQHAMTSAHALASRTISGPDRPPRA